MTEKNTRSNQSAATTKDVATFLAEHPDFFLEYPELLDQMRLPAQKGSSNVTSLAAFQSNRLQTQLHKAQEKNRLLIQTSVQNMESQTQIHELALKVLAFDNMDDMLAALTETLSHMDVDSIRLLLIEGYTTPTGASTISRADFNALFAKGQPAELRTLSQKEEQQIHGPKSENLQSDALIQLTAHDGTPIGLMALGSEKRDRFHAGQGSELLTFLGGLVGYVLARSLGLVEQPARQAG